VKLRLGLGSSERRRSLTRSGLVGRCLRGTRQSRMEGRRDP
jgi:hypothetical protein